MDRVRIELTRNQLGQLLDGLEVLIEQWEATARFLSSGEIDEQACIREASSADEANAIAQEYVEIREKILAQRHG